MLKALRQPMAQDVCSEELRLEARALELERQREEARRQLQRLEKLERKEEPNSLKAGTSRVKRDMV